MNKYSPIQNEVAPLQYNPQTLASECTFQDALPIHISTTYLEYLSLEIGELGSIYVALPSSELEASEEANFYSVSSKVNELIVD
jgi:hypothetical protein